MLESARSRIAAEVPDDAVVLDIGGWADPLPRADWVIDLMPYETRGLYAREGWVEPRLEPERFDADTWIARDICDREPYPFADDAIDFVVCAHTLEDVRDPLFACAEMIRIAKAGYLEVPSRFEEQAWGVAGNYVGWPHHRWLIDVEGERLTFTQKPHSIHARRDQQFPRRFWERLSEDERTESLWWRGGFEYRELTFVDQETSDRHVGAPVRSVLGDRAAAGSPLERLRRLVGR